MLRLQYLEAMLKRIVKVDTWAAYQQLVEQQKHKFVLNKALLTKPDDQF